ncbi:MAG: hypothetical protein H6621_03125 [Halobacteriovoraceae bacterium]|nr:hypothetical protein [Halobacteriovoraceae bacterium]MCB9094038.1 hypothetical protein [Halobacteriovoraceae bacterium]
MKLICLFTSLLLWNFQASAVTTFDEARTLFETSDSMASSYGDFVGSWTPNQLFTDGQGMITLGMIKEGLNLFSGELDGFKYYNQIKITSEDVLIYMDSLLYNIFDKQAKTHLTNLSDTIEFSWSQKIKKNDLVHIYGVDKADAVNLGKVHHSQVCKMIAKNQMICEQTLNSTCSQDLTRYLVYDRF